ncbi:hypothetical protein [Allobaculum mucilyticum]|uniref:hypothetical protein n=1 Tax=Allobaculum mucilyticum TaxID=2834459 RepID=UPI001E5492A8|nr:hypothetical protein [Allobaculum mucilyticum]UNT96773.1 hypothetical protein KWG62_03170 [Allobaculum mucilyticum]
MFDDIDLKDKRIPADAAGSSIEKRTTLTLSLTSSDKKALKLLAAERETTMAALIHEWIQIYTKEDNN